MVSSHARVIWRLLVGLERPRFFTELARRSSPSAVAPGGCVVISTFALDGPEKCSGLPVVRYSAETLAAELGPEFKLVETMNEDHKTPWGAVQRFQFSRFQRR